jgi:hypothetical protein
MRTLIAAFGVVLLVVTAIMPLGCARHGEGGTFDKYGFSLEYPAGYKVDERGAYRTAEAICYSLGFGGTQQGRTEPLPSGLDCRSGDGSAA